MAPQTAIKPDQAARVIRDASRKALKSYLTMCQLDSPWEVPELFLAAEAAKVLAHEQMQRVAVEFKVDRTEPPTSEKDSILPERLRGDAHLDVAILEQAQNGEHYKFHVDGIIEFKKQKSLKSDADLIRFMIEKGRATFGVLALFVAGNTPDDVKREIERWTETAGPKADWRRLSDDPPPEAYPSLGKTGVGHPFWSISCLITP